MMRILHIVPSYKPAYIYGGPIESVSKLCEGLAAQGHTVDVFTTTANGETDLPVEAGIPIHVDGVNVTYFKRNTGDPNNISIALWKQLIKSADQYDLVHIQSWWNLLVIGAAVICHSKKVKVVISPRGMLAAYIFNSGKAAAKKMIHQTVGRWALSKCTFHATAPSEYEECQGVIPGWKGFIAPNLLTLPDLAVTKVKNEVFTLIFMSRIHPKKGIEILFDAISRLKVRVRLKIAGTGDEEYIKQLKAAAQDLGIAACIEWLGWVDRENKFKQLMSADLFVLVSLNENFANVVVEALHVGTPVFLSEDVALSAFVKQYDQGWVTTLAVEDVTEKLTQAINDRDKSAEINNNSQNLIREHFSVVKVIGDYVSAYEEVINNKK
ncbi:XrtY-associated glycosyltransferase XYAG1 [Pedobacter metabolipauper]|uniref:Glycosyltransferase involved in cell wall biosynthesis n=1 Tax=Pedobacter metabolipauper TaxID=425513 RepID=A0A4R6SZL6_9SPHI|nr:glycosyltransferase [Pedobacter metabolipauper]TDQ09995.1 glycosyltransferase involved in cell wall biosynthesis [Pedobacter metabolipauper]